MTRLSGRSCSGIGTASSAIIISAFTRRRTSYYPARPQYIPIAATSLSRAGRWPARLTGARSPVKCRTRRAPGASRFSQSANLAFDPLLVRRCGGNVGAHNSSRSMPFHLILVWRVSRDIPKSLVAWLTLPPCRNAKLPILSDKPGVKNCVFRPENQESFQGEGGMHRFLDFFVPWAFSPAKLGIPRGETRILTRRLPPPPASSARTARPGRCPSS
jgi:hypothetical protein